MQSEDRRDTDGRREPDVDEARAKEEEEEEECVRAAPKVARTEESWAGGCELSASKLGLAGTAEEAA